MLAASLSKSVFLTLLGAFALQAADFSTYRGLKFGMSVNAAGKQAGSHGPEVQRLHSRPSLIEQIEWLPDSSVLATPGKIDAVRDGVMYFFNGELSRIVVTYDRYRVEGMTTEDMIEGVSAVYGMSTKPTTQVPYHTNYTEMAPVLARWQDADYSCDLVRTGDRTSFALILYSKRLDGLAQAAITESTRLDVLEAPQRAIADQKKRDEEQRLALEKDAGREQAELQTIGTMITHAVLKPGAILIERGTRLPEPLRLATASGETGWGPLTDPHQLEEKITTAGWSFLFMAHRLSATAYGFNRERMLDKALKRLVAMVKSKKCNCLEMDAVSTRSFFGLPSISLSAHPRHIQQGVTFVPAGAKA